MKSRILGMTSFAALLLMYQALTIRVVPAANIVTPSAAQLPTWLWGGWSRDWIQKGKVRSSTLDVHYLQTPTFFADVRLPTDRAQLAAATSFADLTDAQLKLLATQNGFTGQTTLAGNIATWHHDIDFQPSDGSTDTGRLQQIPPQRMREHGLDGSYTESWKLRGDAKGPFLVIREEHAGRLLRTLVVVGNQFMYIRNRTKDLPPAESFEALIDSSHASRAQITEFLDCEFSVGRIHGGSLPWQIDRSTLPWREGRHLDFVEQMSATDGGRHLVPRNAGGNLWSVPLNTLPPRQVEALFHAD